MLKRILQLTGEKRNPSNNVLLGIFLAFVAGAINAGGFFLVGNYTSHLTGTFSTAAGNIAIGQYLGAFLMLAYVACFILGATFTSIVVLLSGKHHLNSQYALPLAVEALMITIFSLCWIFADFNIPYYIAALCFLMGLQNALITKASSAIIRTTHISGMSTDLGIEMGKYLFSKKHSEVILNLSHAKLHLKIISSFFIGCVLGAISVKYMGIYTFLVLSTSLFFISAPTVIKDVVIHKKILKRRTR